ncbi:hypothetical protein LVD15_22020 [Fulvivirga maritima]|uniref:hypothetical protein n=1 Tax=Fulvivirga maritima TaxID=2904247 RepID=UPI001F1908D9|nr:hypothetical protein [Fulvivirga maritima]UII25951.1 hypothetical protein LVD15_22020 [Fulvivirga maritima]
MKIKSLSCVALVLMLINISCAQKTVVQTDPNISLKVDRNSDISSSDQKGLLLESGDYAVVRLKFVGPGDKRIDAGMDRTLIIKMPETDELTITDWNTSEGYIEISGCRCLNRGLNPIESGTVKLKKLKNNIWQIEANVTAKGRDNGNELNLEWQGKVQE